MKKRITAILLALIVAAGLGNGSVQQVLAADEDLGKVVDGSLLTEEEESTNPIDPDSIVYVGDEESEDDGIAPYGVYLLDGRSTIRNAGGGKIAATGATNAYKNTTLKLVVTVQRYSGGTWNYVTSWSATKSNARYLSSGKTLSVTKGYYYRVYCAHSAGGESGYSYTNGIWIG